MVNMGHRNEKWRLLAGQFINMGTPGLQPGFAKAAGAEDPGPLWRCSRRGFIRYFGDLNIWK